MFSYESGAFYRRDANVPGLDTAVIKSWFTKPGPPGPHSLTLTPFIFGEDDGGFAPASTFVDFSAPPSGDNWINTDTIKGSSVTATVHADLPEYQTVDFQTTGTNTAIYITTITTRVVFDQIFVYFGSSIPVGNSITVSKGQSCFALAVFKKEVSKATNHIDTHQWPRIPKWEWPMIISEIIKAVGVKGSGEVFEYMSPKLIAKAQPEELKQAVASISKRIEELGKVMTIIDGISRRSAK
jgi:hypothetical protein